VYTDNIWDEGSWSDPIWTQMHGIDPDVSCGLRILLTVDERDWGDTLKRQLFFDDDDRVYLSSAPVCGPHHGITSDPIPHLITMGCEIDIRTGRSLSPSVILRVSEYGRKIAEGPHIYKIKGWYYLLTAEGGTQEHHRAMITRSKSPLGPYEEPPEGINPLIFNDQDPDVRHTGHADIFEGSDGRWWATCLGIRPQENGVAPLLRETFLTPLEWNEDGWPVIKGKIALDIPADLPKRAKREVWRDDFDQRTSLLPSSPPHCTTSTTTLTALTGKLTCQPNCLQDGTTSARP
jgi:beta-xylosidase